jgi:hypothetical protein
MFSTNGSSLNVHVAIMSVVGPGETFAGIGRRALRRQRNGVPTTVRTMNDCPSHQFATRAY